MRHSLTTTLLAVVLSTISLAGCQNQVDAPQPVSPTNGAQAGLPPADGKPTLPFFHAAMKLDLNQAQKDDLAKTQAAFEARMAPVKTAEAALMRRVADGVAAGTVDRAALTAEIAAVDAAQKEAAPAFADAANQLHKILTPAQRTALVEQLSHRGPRGEKGGPDKERGEHADRGDHGKRDHGHGPFGMMKDLNLSDEQKTQMRDAMKAAFDKHEGGDRGAEHRGGMHKMRELADAFQKDTFDARGVEAPMPPPMADHMVRFAVIATPILTPEQRKTFAEKLRAKAS